MDKATLEHAIKSIKWSIDRPVFVEAGIAYELLEQGVKANYYKPAWWDELITGFTGFVFLEDNRVGQSELNILYMNRYNTAFDVPAVIDFRTWIYAPNLDVPEAYSNQCILAKNPDK